MSKGLYERDASFFAIHQILSSKPKVCFVIMVVTNLVVEFCVILSLLTSQPPYFSSFLFELQVLIVSQIQSGRQWINNDQVPLRLFVFLNP